jgi:transcriptional regulator with XRE-family HTH domain
MSTNPLRRLPKVFGDVLARRRRERNWDVEALAEASNVPVPEIHGLEAGSYTPNLRDFFRFAIGLEESPVLLLVELINGLRSHPSDHGLYKSRPSDSTRLYRLGYFHDPGDFRELPRAYSHMNEATDAVRSLNAARQAKALPLVNTITTYVRVGSVSFRLDEEDQS